MGESKCNILIAKVSFSDVNYYCEARPTSLNDILHRTQQQTQKSKSFIEKFKADTRDPGVKRFEINGKFTIDNVQKQADEAMEAYKSRGTDWRHRPLRTAARHVGEDISAFKDLLTFLPDGDYTSILCGVLTLFSNVRSNTKISSKSC